MRQRGISLIEMLVALAIVALTMGAVARTYIFGLGFERQYVRSIDERTLRQGLEDRITRLLGGAKLGGESGYLVSPIPASSLNKVQPGNGPLGSGSASLAWTSWTGSRPSSLTTAKQEFESLNSRFGPQGGATEVALSTVPAGDAGRLQGLFLREQRPPDTDATQGGEEGLLEAQVEDIRFSFYDGSDWADSWDSRGAQKDRLPTAVRTAYLLKGQTRPHTFLVRLPLAKVEGGGS
jgi:prepilin-type N-terminal cleavage/methylation domain-containing protein